MTAVLRRLDTFPPGYRVEVDGVHAGDVFKTDHPYWPSVPIWYGYLPGQNLPLDPSFTRAETVDNLVRELAKANGVESQP